MVWNVEFHCHTRWSKDSLNDPAALLRTLQQRQLDRLFITDHNSIAGAKVAQALDPQHILIGEEIRTQQGELLALFVREEVPARLPAQQTIQLLRQQGAFISVSHPFDRQRGWQLPDLLDILPQIDAIETFNARCLSNRPNQQAADFAAAHNLPGTVGSDAHTLAEVGRATLHLPPFNDAESLRQSIRHATAQVRLSGWEVHLASTLARLYKRLANK
ncbi:MAG: PHP domain-containing protein [Longilinea sp.]|nr:PHP domain-containing protein [Longilinea sp.]